jgi:hypothetical protein
MCQSIEEIHENLQKFPPQRQKKITTKKKFFEKQVEFFCGTLILKDYYYSNPKITHQYPRNFNPNRQL